MPIFHIVLEGEETSTYLIEADTKEEAIEIACNEDSAGENYHRINDKEE